MGKEEGEKMGETLERRWREKKAHDILCREPAQ